MTVFTSIRPRVSPRRRPGTEPTPKHPSVTDLLIRVRHRCTKRSERRASLQLGGPWRFPGRTAWPDTPPTPATTGLIVYSPLAQGLLTDKYLESIPERARAQHSTFLTADVIDETYPAAHRRAQQDCRGPWPVTCTARVAVGTAAAGGHLGADRSQFDRAARPRYRGPELPAAHRRRTRPHRGTRRARNRTQALTDVKIPVCFVRRGLVV